MQKLVAKSLTTILENPLMQVIQDKSKDVDEVIDKVLDLWQFDLYKRKPGPAYTEDDIFVGTDLDLATFLFALMGRGAVINIPKYKCMRPSSKTPGTIVVSEDNRHGQIVGLTSNKSVFTFSVKIKDMNVITADSVGDFRNFSLTSPTGEWYPGWSNIEFTPSAKENKFLDDHDIWTDNKIIFKNFISPNRWVSFYGKSYFITKALIERLSDEGRFYYSKMKEMAERGIRLPSKGYSTETEDTSGDKGEAKVFTGFEVEIDLPSNNSKYKDVEISLESLTYITERRKRLIYSVLPKLRFVTRATELAFYKYGNYNFPAWIQNAKWQTDFVAPGKRTKWNRLVLFQPGVGEYGVSIRCRETQVKDVVSQEYALIA